MRQLVFFFAICFWFAHLFQVYAIYDDIKNQKNSRNLSVNISYLLPWPGILPDHPLYVIKKIRDILVLKLLKTPQKKLANYILQADKGIYATLLLVNKGNITLAKKLALRAEHNYTLAVTEYTNLVYTGQEIPESIRYAMLQSPLKHQEVLQVIIDRLQSDENDTFRQVLDFSKRNLNLTQRVANDETKRKITP